LDDMRRRLRAATANLPEGGSVAFVQFGGGYFGRGPTVGAEACNAQAFACSVSLERPELAVRVLDVDAAADVRATASRRVAELGGAGFVAAGVDAEGTRRVGRVVPLQPKEYAPAAPLGASDVVVVTGGGRGITAECALELAMAGKPKMALV